MQVQTRSAAVIQSQSSGGYREKVLAHAARRLSGIERLSSPEISQLFRSFLRVEDQRLQIAHRCGASGRWTAESLSFVLDILVEHAFRVATGSAQIGERSGVSKNSCAIVALGGYGRGELAPFSDLDLLFLHSGRQGAQIRQLVERVLRLLWDAGLTVGPSFHTVKECVSAAQKDLHLQTALTTTR